MKTQRAAKRLTARRAASGSPKSEIHRDRVATQKKILTAMGRLLARRGSSGLGINAIAREARVDKVLIYRYFGGLEQLYRAFALEGGTFPSLEEVAGRPPGELAKLPPGDAVKSVVLGFAREIRRRPVTREMLRWELQERNALTDALAAERDRQALQWLALAPNLPGLDLPAVASILVAGQIFLTLRAKTAETYNGIDLRSDSGWKRIEDGAALLSDLFFRHAAEIARNTVDGQGGPPGRAAMN